MKRVGRLGFPLFATLVLTLCGPRLAQGAAPPPSLQTRAALDSLLENEAGLERGGFGALLFSDREELWS